MLLYFCGKLRRNMHVIHAIRQYIFKFIIIRNITYIFNRYGVDSFKIKTYKLLLTIFFENLAINLKTKHINCKNQHNIIFDVIN